MQVLSAFTPADKRFMSRAIRLARNAKGKTFPNPAVGAVIVTNGEVVGSGATQVCGGPHAEKVAIGRAGGRAENGTLYVTLEPCCHYGRTPPCTDAIVKAGIKRVVIAVEDPNPLVAKKGIQQLESAGITVQRGLKREEAIAVNEDFFWFITQKTSWVTVKLAMTLDGRIADSFGTSKWITTRGARRYVHELRRCHAAIGVGKNTLLADNPQLTVRHKKGVTPIRIVFSPDRTIPETTYFYRHAADVRSIVVVPGGNEPSIEKAHTGLEYWYTGTTDRKTGLQRFLTMAHEQGITSVFIEGGQKLASLFLECGFVNRLYLFYGNRILGQGHEGILFSEGLPIQKCITLTSQKVRTIESDIVVTGIPVVTKVSHDEI